MKRGIIGIGMVALATAGAAGAEPAVSPEDLARRFEAAEAEVWPDLQIQVSLQGCEIRVERAGADGGSENGRFWLADLQTDPAPLVEEAGWPGYVAYDWRPEVIAANAEAVAKWQEDHAQIKFAASDDVLTTMTQEEQDALEARAESKLKKALHEAAGQGLYGPFFQRNQAWLDWDDPLYGPSFAVDQMVFVSKTEAGETTGFLAPLHFYVAESVAQGLITDLHLYAQQACAPPE